MPSEGLAEKGVGCCLMTHWFPSGCYIAHWFPAGALLPLSAYDCLLLLLSIPSSSFSSESQTTGTHQQMVWKPQKVSGWATYEIAVHRHCWKSDYPLPLIRCPCPLLPRALFSFEFLPAESSELPLVSCQKSPLSKLTAV